MAKYILLEVDSNSLAGKLVVKFHAMVSKGVRVAAVFPKAILPCQCESPVRNKNGSIIDVQGSKYKWMVCPSCHKPRPDTNQLVWNEFDNRLGAHSGYRAASLSVRWVLDPETGRLTTDIGQS
jgi:hypothetical protein